MNHRQECLHKFCVVKVLQLWVAGHVAVDPQQLTCWKGQYLGLQPWGVDLNSSPPHLLTPRSQLDQPAPPTPRVHTRQTVSRPGECVIFTKLLSEPLFCAFHCFEVFLQGTKAHIKLTCQVSGPLALYTICL